MSELKARMLGQTMNEYGCDTKIYLKSEADKVIAELKRQIEFLKVTHDSCGECNKCADGMGKVFDENLKELKDKCQMHDFFWEGCGFAKRGFKNTIAVSEAFDNLEAENIRLRKRLFRMCARLGKMGYIAFHNIQTKLKTFGDGEGVTMASMKKNQWRNVERKCIALAEKFKEAK